ncbi:hypothetical protein [Chryseobacterium sp. JK1]|uniref:hypothetical protein n=1 Tax=Chryseobacterium sp. JK1 TaxID=874294 RepID=UPI003D69B509
MNIINKMVVISTILLLGCNSNNNYKKCLPVDEKNEKPLVKKIILTLSESNNVKYIDVEFRLKPVLTKEKEMYFYFQKGNDNYFINYPIEDSAISTANKRLYIYNTEKLFEERKKEKKIHSSDKSYYYIEDKDLRDIICNIVKESKIVSQNFKGNELSSYTFNQNSEVLIVKKNINDVIIGKYMLLYPKYKAR